MLIQVYKICFENLSHVSIKIQKNRVEEAETSQTFILIF